MFDSTIFDSCLLVSTLSAKPLNLFFSQQLALFSDYNGAATLTRTVALLD
jgi:hypothetical protein